MLETGQKKVVRPADLPNGHRSDVQADDRFGTGSRSAPARIMRNAPVISSSSAWKRKRTLPGREPASAARTAAAP